MALYWYWSLPYFLCAVFVSCLVPLKATEYCLAGSLNCPLDNVNTADLIAKLPSLPKFIYYNESEDIPNVCDTNADCTNTPGSHECSCRARYSGNGVTCTECDDGKYGLGCASECSCVLLGTCDKVTGECSCVSIPGFSGAVCDKDDFEMSLTRADGMTGPVDDTQSIDNVELICTVNVLPVDLVGSVFIRYPDGSEYPTTHTISQPGVYSKTIEDVHTGDSGDYTCVTTILLRPSDSIIEKTSVYRLTVVDVDECATNMYQCNVNAYCVNEDMDGGYNCVCNSGYRFAADGVTCEGEVPPNNVAIIAVISILSTLLIVAAAIIIVVFLRSKVNRESRITQAVGSTVEMNPTHNKRTIDSTEQAEAAVYEDVGLPSWAVRWQILRSDLGVDDTVLGRGNFGEVRSGTVDQSGQRTKCAIKILKGQASPSDREDFLEEFRTMTRIGYHPNVVSLIGACQHQDVLYVALEYLPHGDLRNHLRSSRPDSDSEQSLTSEQLIKFALDVAMGMEHLESSTVIHRDLAARNILLGRGFVAKVSDFGLSRGEDIYVQTSMRRVPTRWLSIESILHKTYTTKSDVWSFGILLWEIATLGGTPYPTMKTKDLASQLTDGYRMSKPPNCDEKIYTLMTRCWGENPTNRPSFSDLVTALSGMNESQINHTYMAFIQRPHYENFSVIRPELDDN